MRATTRVATLATSCCEGAGPSWKTAAFVAAADDVREHGGLLDEARVNLLRYLDGTPKGSTRWIDSRWALAAWQKASGLVRAATADAGRLRVVQADDGQSRRPTR